MAFGGENADSYYDEGLTASLRGDLKRAVECFEAAIRLDDAMAAAYHQLGKCHLRLGRGESAVGLLRQAVAKRPNQIQARLDLGLALLEVDRVADARNQFKQAMALDPANGKTQLALARADFQEGNWTGAMAQAQTALAGGGTGFAVYFMLGRAAKLAGNPVLAENSLDKADVLIEEYLKLNPDRPEGHFLRGEVAFVKEHFPAALEYYRAAEDHAANVGAYVAYGETFTLADVLAKQGLCLQRLDRPERVREIGRRIGEIDPGHKLGKALREA